MSYANQSCGRVARRAFTLIELLVVMSIIAMLIAILLPTLAGARESARQAQCGSSLHQLAVSFYAYATDSRDAMPYSGWRNLAGTQEISFDDLVSSYINASRGALEMRALETPAERASTLLRCPSDDAVATNPIGRTYATMGRTTSSGGDPLSRGYANLVTDPAWKPWRLGTTDFPDVTGTGMLSERNWRNLDPVTKVNRNRQGSNNSANMMSVDQQDPRVFVPANPNIDLRAVHGSDRGPRANYAFVDGHVALLDPKDTWDGTNLASGAWTRRGGD